MRRGRQRNVPLKKPGFYKKGPGGFTLYFGAMDELVEKAERDKAKPKEKQLKRVKETEEEDQEAAADVPARRAVISIKPRTGRT